VVAAIFNNRVENVLADSEQDDRLGTRIRA